MNAYRVDVGAHVPIPLRGSNEPIVAPDVGRSSRNPMQAETNRKRRLLWRARGKEVCADVCEARKTTPCSDECAARLASLVAQVLTDTASENPRIPCHASSGASALLNRAGRDRARERIIDGMPVGLLSVNREGEITWSNQPAKTLLGLSRDARDEVECDSMVCTVAGIDGADPVDSYVRITRRLARGETVRGIRCLLCTPDDCSFQLLVDAAPTLSRHHIDRIQMSFRPVDEVGQSGGGSQPSWAEARTILNVVNTRAASKRADVAHTLQLGVVEELQCAWLELDRLRQELWQTDQPRVSGYLDSVASYLQQAVANAALLSSECQPHT